MLDKSNFVFKNTRYPEPYRENDLLLPFEPRYFTSPAARNSQNTFGCAHISNCIESNAGTAVPRKSALRCVGVSSYYRRSGACNHLCVGFYLSESEARAVPSRHGEIFNRPYCRVSNEIARINFVRAVVLYVTWISGILIYMWIGISGIIIISEAY